ncbi:Superoxide-generating NADPH oxidase heavy chain subunit A [Smittium culicis]|uniref:Superoxide-generating NADPH oxidase heavy chain subunit A n=1 Tax=Smittium culicis TaxID=133412 RepID=A0A1R1XZF3_9FUNG|nr:Superoxide-generating NADPH oxidase heavy chain subunit A [Smittium culicis]
MSYNNLSSSDEEYYSKGIGAFRGWLINKGSREKFGATFIIARTSAFLIHANVAMILIPVCRNVLTLFRKSFLSNIIPFDENITFHKLVGWSIVFFSIVHSIAHYRNYYVLYLLTNKEKSLPYMLLVSGPSWTGHIMLIALALIAIPALDRFRRKNFNLFWYTHHSFSIFFAMFSIHGAFCLLKPANPPYCKSGAVFYKYYLLGGLLYLIERILREYRGTRASSGVISKVILHPARVVEVQFKKNSLESCKAGQYVFINCPAVSLNEWHPFTLTSAPEENYYSVHIRVVGDWTRKFAKSVGVNDLDADLKPTPNNLLDFSDYNNRRGFNDIQSLKKSRLSRFLDVKTLVLPELMIDGPFGSASEHVFQHEVAMLFGAGIGVTPFASILKSMWYRFNNNLDIGKLRKVYFIWSQKETGSFVWFQDLLEAIEEKEEENYNNHNSQLRGNDSFSHPSTRATSYEMGYSGVDISEINSSASSSRHIYPPSQRYTKFLDIRMHLTARFSLNQINNLVMHDSEGFKDAITNLRAPTIYGRPDLNKIFTEVATNHPGADVGVFFCGPAPMGTQIEKKAHYFTTNFKTRTKFTYNKENF